MDKSLDDYIANESTLQAGMVRAKFRSNYHQRYHNFEKFRAESQQYICNSISEDAPGNNQTLCSSANTRPINLVNALEKEFLDINLNENMRLNLMGKHTVDGNDNSYNNNIRNNQACHSEKTIFGQIPKIDSNVELSCFDLRRKIGVNVLDGQQNGLQTPQSKKQYKNTHKQNRKKECGNHFMRNNTPYKKFQIGGNFENSNKEYNCGSLCTQNVCSRLNRNRNLNFGTEYNAACCSFHKVPMLNNELFNCAHIPSHGDNIHLNMNVPCQNNFCATGCQPYPHLNGLLSCAPMWGCNPGVNAFGNGNNFQNIANGGAACCGNSNPSSQHMEHQLKHIFDMMAGGGAHFCHNNN